MTDPFASWIERDIVRASGPDTIVFLQGQLSQDIEPIAVGAGAWSLLLAPTGKVDAWLRVTRVDAELIELDTDAGFGAAVLERLARFKLRTKCELALERDVRCLAVRGVTIDDPSARAIVWPGEQGADLFGTAVSAPPGVALTDDYEPARIRSGVPAMGRELTDATIPVEAGQWLIDASVSFTKGCYTGQELVARIDSRGGNAPRPIRGLRVAGRVEEGSTVLTVDGSPAGRVTSVAFDAQDNESIALAPLSRTVEPGASVLVGDARGLVVALPMT